MSKRPKSQDDNDLSFEERIEKVEAIIDRIDAGEIGLEEALTEYEQGMAHIRRCKEVLERAQQRVEELARQTGADTSKRAGKPVDEQSEDATEDED
jgi:exodeoxyribonuclease VII small subunit